VFYLDEAMIQIKNGPVKLLIRLSSQTELSDLNQGFIEMYEYLEME